jgi:phosphomannomutase
VGSPYVVGAMVKNHSKFGFEANGGAFSGEIMLTRDGGSTSIKFLNIMAKSGKSIEELVEELPKYYLSKAKVDYKWELQDEILKKAKDKFKGIKIDSTDGLKIWIDTDTWMLFRSSQNAPEFRIFAESKDKKLSEKLLKDGLNFVKSMV